MIQNLNIPPFSGRLPNRFVWSATVHAPCAVLAPLALQPPIWRSALSLGTLPQTGELGDVSVIFEVYPILIFWFPY